MKNRPAPQACLAAAMLLAAVSTHAQGPKPVAAGDASISGRVIERGTERPLAGVVLTLISADYKASTSTKTRADGTYTLDKVPAGNYQLVAGHDDYVQQAFGVADAGAEKQGIISVGARDRVIGIDFVLTRGAHIRGQVSDSSGKPLARANVQVLPAQTAATSRPARMASTDDNGIYRVARLPEGEYVVRAAVGSFRTLVVEGKLVMTSLGHEHEPTFYPGVRAVEDAHVIRLSTGDVAENVNLSLLRAEYFDINGYVATSGPLPDKIELVLTGVPSGSMRRQGRAAIKEDGAFSFLSMKPGRYVLWARAPHAAGVDVASMTIDLDRTLDGVRLELMPAAKLSGRVVTERGDPLPPHGFRIAAILMAEEKDIDPRSIDQVEVAVDGRFTISGVFGDRMLRVFGLPPEWQVIRIESGRAPIERLTVQPGLDIDDLVVVLGRR